ncbi:type II secretion system minor pseudopilin GspI [Neptunicella marina]|uniref:Type II secretion system protein I n=2 Tax=Neptunicella marina TaxID=2125989 RepID=A0A8J6IUS7_9ALTE|nr:type II secretion system minor pseudopilin GspI [Neptunicella marina]
MTLLEVMVALAIFALAGTAIMKAASEHLHSIGVLEETTYATWVANNKLAEVQLSKQWPPKNNDKGEVEMASRKWQWKQLVSKTSDDNMRMVEVEVSDSAQPEQIITSVQTFVTRVKK